ncbi:hypothetical protein GDO81_025070 [Engystomops pustulosus]|uniref:Uncharacterized protein n=1 Tax=Engystomops pustulosus TaxID=76066 RepID=A0AAV6YIS3_ENGPU|nr:hypothetical protein GDO81_025070 [Engystomops pustulosus]
MDLASSTSSIFRVSRMALSNWSKSSEENRYLDSIFEADREVDGSNSRESLKEELSSESGSDSEAHIKALLGGGPGRLSEAMEEATEEWTSSLMKARISSLKPVRSSFRRLSRHSLHTGFL